MNDHSECILHKHNIIPVRTSYYYHRPVIFLQISSPNFMRKINKILTITFSSNMGITLLLGPFWAIRPLKYHISAHFGKTRFFPEKRPCTFLALIVVNFHAKYKENPLIRLFFEKNRKPTNQPLR